MTKSKKILFVHPLGQNWTPGERDMSRIANIMAPMGLLSLAAWVDKNSHQSAIHDCYAFPGEDHLIYEYIINDKPQYLGISTTTSSFPDGVRIAQEAKQIAPYIKVVFGGVHISALRKKILEDYLIIDYAVVGEGELALQELMDGKNLAEIGGLIYRENEKVIFKDFRKDQAVMDDLPFPAYEKLKGYPESYQLPIFSYPKAPNTTIITSRGCPYTCSYCDRSVFKRSYRSNSPQYMMDMLQHLQDKFNIRHVNIYDDTFTLKRQRVIDFCELKIKSGLKITFNCAARAEQVDFEMLKIMKKAGCWMISLGIETGDPELLKKHRSYLPRDNVQDPLGDIREKITLIKKAGIRVKGLFMMGLPGETEDSINKSMDYVFSLPLDEFNLAKLTPFPGAPMYSTIHQYGYFEENWELMNALNFVFVPNGLTQDKLEERYREFYRRYFTRPKILLNYASMIWKSPHSWLRFLKNIFIFMQFTREYGKN